MLKKLLSILAAAALSVSVLAVVASADEAAAPENYLWSFVNDTDTRQGDQHFGDDKLVSNQDESDVLFSWSYPDMSDWTTYSATTKYDIKYNFVVVGDDTTYAEVKPFYWTTAGWSWNDGYFEQTGAGDFTVIFEDVRDITRISDASSIGFYLSELDPNAAIYLVSIDFVDGEEVAYTLEAKEEEATPTGAAPVVAMAVVSMLAAAVVISKKR